MAVSRSVPINSARRSTTTDPLRCLPSLQCTRTVYPIMIATKAIRTARKRRTSHSTFNCNTHCRIVRKLFWYCAHQFYRPGNVTEYYSPGLNVTALEHLLNCTAPGNVLDYQKRMADVGVAVFCLNCAIRLNMSIVVNIVMLCLKSCVCHVLVFIISPGLGTLNVFPGQSRSVTFSGLYNELSSPGH